MLTPEILRVALDAIRANKLRSFLTMLGIVIGIAAVIAVVALGEGAQQAVEDQIAELGTDVLTVRPGQGLFRGVRSGEVPLTIQDARAVERGAPAVAAVAPEVQRTLRVQAGRQNAELRIVGTTPEFTRVNRYRPALGRFFDERETEGRRRVAVLGGDVPDVLGVPAIELLDSHIHIRGIRFEVVGILESKGTTGWFNEDEQIWVPITTAQYRLMGTDRLRSFNVTVADGSSMELAMMQIEDIVRREHRLRPGQDNDFWVQNRADLLGAQQETAQTFGFLLAGIAAVSLLVGGIGIMNIMLVSVTERTREIGLRKALGAKRRDVLLQFLMEALTLCFLGGLVGIAVGGVSALLLASLAGWNTTVSANAVLLAVGFSVAVGLFFGLWPARRAARLDPIEALRYE